MYPIYIDSLAVFSAYIFRWNRGGERGRERERRAIHRVDSFILVFFSSHPQDKRRGGEGRPSYLLVVNGRRDESFRIAIRCLVPSLALRLNYMKIEHASRERERESSRSIATAQIRGKIIAPRPQELLLLERLRGSNESRRVEKGGEGKEKRETDYSFLNSLSHRGKRERRRRFFLTRPSITIDRRIAYWKRLERKSIRVCEKERGKKERELDLLYRVKYIGRGRGKKEKEEEDERKV